MSTKMNGQNTTDELLRRPVVEPTKLIPTGTPLLDELLGGGLEPNHVYAILGPTGVGKSTMMSRIAVGAAWHFAQHEPSKVAVQFHLRDALPPLPGDSMSRSRPASTEPLSKVVQRVDSRTLLL